MNRSISLLVSLTFVCPIAACGSGEEPQDTDESPQSSKDPTPETKDSQKPDESDASDQTPEGSQTPTETSTGSTNSSGENTDPGSTDSTDSSDTNPDPGGSPEEANEVCKRYREAFSDKGEGEWSGNVEACEPGDISQDARERALAQINFIRWLTGLKSVTTDPALDKQAQACALMMHANQSLSHDPPSSWKCYTSDGAKAAKKSNISSAPGVRSVLLYMIDPGNATTIGHRRWIVANRFGPTGLGSTSKSSCMFTIGGSQNGDRKWTAWPPPGVFPTELNSNDWTSMDKTGWTIQSDTLTFDGKAISVKANGQDKPVDIAQLLPNFGARNAVKITPKGWKMTAGTKYEVSVEGTEIQYAFDAVSCK